MPDSHLNGSDSTGNPAPERRPGLGHLSLGERAGLGLAGLARVFARGFLWLAATAGLAFALSWPLWRLATGSRRLFSAMAGCLALCLLAMPPLGKSLGRRRTRKARRP